MFEEAKFEDGDTEQLTYKVCPWKPPVGHMGWGMNLSFRWECRHIEVK